MKRFTIGIVALFFLLGPASAHAAAGTAADAGAGTEKDLGTLDEINIEGEIPLPQVLFISSREQPRYADEVHKRYLTGLDFWLSRPIFPKRIITAPKGLDQQEEY
ncbi:MAG: hypothetical protein HKN20_04770 [Gemmatimonadetes bacterium]|nr:hypothetical protein [Gemmatimonadota bacterium]